MAATPEGKVKRKVSTLLSRFPRVYYEMPVPGGFGKTTLDYIGCANGRFFSIETKAPGGKPTERQWSTIRQMERAGAVVRIIDGQEHQLKELESWLISVGADQPTAEPMP
jgi:hypothetical protein